MVYDTEDHCVFVLFPLSDILKKTKELNVSEIYLFPSSGGGGSIGSVTKC
jgi:hypothetical protein